MLASILKSKVKLQEKQVITGPLGQTVVWKPAHEYHARVVPLDVHAVAQFMQLNTRVTHKVILRGTVEVDLGSHRILYGSKTFLPQQSAKHYDGVTEIVVQEE